MQLNSGGPEFQIHPQLHQLLMSVQNQFRPSLHSLAHLLKVDPGVRLGCLEYPEPHIQHELLGVTAL
jgi:hypothetical protein